MKWSYFAEFDKFPVFIQKSLSVAQTVSLVLSDGERQTAVRWDPEEISLVAEGKVLDDHGVLSSQCESQNCPECPVVVLLSRRILFRQVNCFLTGSDVE